MATSQRRKTGSTNKDDGGQAVPAAVGRYLKDLARAPLAERTKDAYGQHVTAYGAWLGDAGTVPPR